MLIQASNVHNLKKFTLEKIVPTLESKAEKNNIILLARVFEQLGDIAYSYTPNEFVSHLQTNPLKGLIPEETQVVCKQENWYWFLSNHYVKMYLVEKVNMLKEIAMRKVYRDLSTGKKSSQTSSILKMIEESLKTTKRDEGVIYITHEVINRRKWWDKNLIKFLKLDDEPKEKKD